MSEMRHENIVMFYELYETENSYYMILELFKFSLADFLVIHGFPSL
jgi:serine/threonine protein kinase